MKMKTDCLDVDFCVVGGGLAGLCAALAAARRGASVALMQDRPVLGGNASSEVRMWVCGAEQPCWQEGGIIEELLLENHCRNPDRNPCVWDSVLFGAALAEPRLALLLNCSCLDAEMDGDRIVSATGWQTTTQRFVKVRAKLFADCSGDSILAPLTGAEFRIGREAREEFGESLAPAEADAHTMGMSCLIQARETASPQPFTPPDWATRFDGPDALKPNMRAFNPHGNYWWLELGGMGDSIADTEAVRDRLLKTALGLWDYYKNISPERGAENWALDWIGFLPGKRESRRCLGDVILTQRDIAEGRAFDDAVAYGGWPLDDHDPHGFDGTTPSNVSIPLRDPFQIPFRSLYSRNVANLLFAGRNISVSHAALSSSRVMCTCAAVGQAVGTAAAIAARDGLTPRGLYGSRIAELRQSLMEDDCLIPGATRAIPEAARAARLFATAPEASGLEHLRDGIDRDTADKAEHAAAIPLGAAAGYEFPSPSPVSAVRIVFDSELGRNGSHKANIVSNYFLDAAPQKMPASLARDFAVEYRDADGAWRTLAQVSGNRRRLVKVAAKCTATALRLTATRLWGGGRLCRVFAFDFNSR